MAVSLNMNFDCKVARLHSGRMEMGWTSTVGVYIPNTDFVNVLAISPPHFAVVWNEDSIELIQIEIDRK